MDLTGKVALVTSGRRIGATIAVTLAARGVDVSLSYNRSRDVAEETAAHVRDTGRRALVTKVDVSSSDSVRRLVDTTVKGLGRLDVVINMASVYRQTAFDGLTDDAWREPLAIDLGGSYRCAQAAVPHMRAAGGGHIVNFSDWAAASGRPRYNGYLPYYVAKRGVIGLTEALALELAQDHILVNAIAPGPIVPPTDLDTEAIKEVERVTPLGRWGGADEIAAAVVGLLETDFVTGETIRVDGGRHVR